jgi:hypothetical protein
MHFVLKMQTMTQVNVHYLFNVKCTCFMKLSLCYQPSILLSMHIWNKNFDTMVFNYSFWFKVYGIWKAIVLSTYE